MATTNTTTNTTTNEEDLSSTTTTDVSSSELVSNIDTSSVLFDSGLQNIYNSYQESVASLDASKQQDIEDAYFTKEMSKQYLGEYASNNQMFDVSGNLLDIYGNYQDNITEINTNYSELQYNLEQAYNESVEAYNLESAYGEINYNLSTGLIPDGMTEIEYIESVRDTLGESAYWELMTSYKGLEMTETIDNALSSFRDYATQEEWDTYIDELLSSGKLNNTQAEYLIAQWEIQQSTNFTLVSDYASNDISYYNPNNTDIVANGKYYTSANGEHTLAETNNVIYSDHINYDAIVEKAQETGSNTPFAVGNAWYVESNGEIKEYVIAESGVSTYSGTYDNTSSFYDTLSSNLNGQSGNYGNVHYEYDSTNDTYKAYINYSANEIGNEKGTIQIGASTYSFDGNEDRIENGNLKPLFGSNKTEFENVYSGNDLAAMVLQEMARVYFNGSQDDLWTNVLKGNPNDVESTYVVTIDGKYYTVNDGQIYELKKD